MAEFIGNGFEWFLTTIYNGTTSIIHTAEALFSVAGTIVAFIIICRLAHSHK